MSVVICANCGRPIVSDGGEWTHDETGMPRCEVEYFATPEGVS